MKSACVRSHQVTWTSQKHKPFKWHTNHPRHLQGQSFRLVILDCFGYTLGGRDSILRERAILAFSPISLVFSKRAFELYILRIFFIPHHQNTKFLFYSSVKLNFCSKDTALWLRCSGSVSNLHWTRKGPYEIHSFYSGDKMRCRELINYLGIKRFYIKNCC